MSHTVVKTLASLHGTILNNLSPPVTFYIILFWNNCVKKIQFPTVLFCYCYWFLKNLSLEVAPECLVSI